MTTYFDKIEKISFEGEKSTNPFAFKHYDANQVILGKTMAEHLRLARFFGAKLAEKSQFACWCRTKSRHCF